MNQAASVCRVECGAQTSEYEEGFLRRQRRTRCETLAQRLAFEQFHDQERLPFVIDAEVVDPHHVSVGETGRGPRLRRNRASTRPGAPRPNAVLARSSRITFTATFRSRTSSVASYTAPMPPRPRRRSSRYRPFSIRDPGPTEGRSPSWVHSVAPSSKQRPQVSHSARRRASP